MIKKSRKKCPKGWEVYVAGSKKNRAAITVVHKKLKKGLIIFLFPFFDEDDIRDISIDFINKIKGVKLYQNNKLYSQDSGLEYLKTKEKFSKFIGKTFTISELLAY